MARTGGDRRATDAPSLRGAYPRAALEFQLAGPAVSAQSRNRRLLGEWSARVAQAARSAWPVGRPPMAGEVEVTISEFSEAATRDRDNMAKPILDAMQGVAYENDRQVRSVHVEWCDIAGAYVVRYMSPVVAAALVAGREFLWVRVSVHVPRRSLIR